MQATGSSSQAPLAAILERRRFLQLGAATVALVLGAGLARPGAAAPAGRLVFANAEPPTANYWDPAAGFGLVDEQVASLVHDTLLQLDASGAFLPRLATAWERTSPTTMRVTIRTDARFHDGSPVTAEDVAASWTRLGEGKLAQSITVTPGITATVVDASTVEITTPEPFGPLESALAFVKILRKADIEAPDNFKQGAMGSGPYKFVSCRDNDVTLAANPDYWGGAPKIQEVVFRYIEDNQARIAALLDGQVDILTRVSAEDMSRVEGNAGFSIVKVGPPAQIIAILQHNGPLKDVRLRHAIAYAVDRQAIAQNIMRGVNPVAYSSLPSVAPFYEPLDNRFEPDLEKAKALVAEAAPDGVTLSMATSTLVPNQLDIDQAIAAFLEQVGIRTEITRLEVGAFRSSYNQYDITLNTLASFTNDPDFILGLYTGGAGEAIWHFKDAEYDKLLAAARTAVGDARQAAITAAAKHLWDNQVTLYLSDEIWYFIVAQRVQGYGRAPVVGEILVPAASVT
jgi:peptide/nickel transport system substrate-binding protein